MKTLFNFQIYAFVAAAVTLPVSVFAQSETTTLAEQYKLYKVQDTVGSLGDNLFGDQVSYYHGQAQFVQTDVSLKGNFDLPVSVGRRFDPTQVADWAYRLGHFKDWDLEIPRIHTVFAPLVFAQPPVPQNNWHVGDRGAASANRCSEFSPPHFAFGEANNFFPTSLFFADEFWHGYSLYVPGIGDQQLLDNNLHHLGPGDGVVYPVVTKNFWIGSCVPVANPGGNVEGEGFLFTSPDGTKYKMDWLVSRPYEMLIRWGVGQEPRTNETPQPEVPICCLQGTPRREGWLLPTEVKDRFNNTVTYTYNPSQPWQLLEIRASDGRKLTLTYVAGSDRIQTVSDGTHTWTYVYSGAGLSTSLSRVTLPDGSAWSFDFSDLGNMGLVYPAQNPSHTCDQHAPMLRTRTARMTHPSGAVGEFTFEPRRIGITQVPHACISSTVIGGNPVGIRYRYPRLLDSNALVRKRITGPGLSAPSVWSLDFEQGTSCWAPDEDPTLTNVCPLNAVKQRNTTLTYPDGSRTRFTFGNEHWKTEGDLLATEIQASDGEILRRSVQTYFEPNGSQAFPDPVGESILLLGDQRNATSLRLAAEHRITQKGIDFSSQRSGFDAFGHVTTEVQTSTITGLSPPSRTQVHTLENRIPAWVLGLRTSTKDGASNALMDEVTYHSVSHLPTTVKSFGRLVQTLGYRADGNLMSVKDANNHTTLLENWYRGVPQLITQPDTLIQTSTVNASGWIESTTNQLRDTTCYAYDLMGRMTSLTHPSETAAGLCNETAWTASRFSFAPDNCPTIGCPTYGLPVGHWKQTSATGNGISTTHFDALWRPSLTVTEVSGDTSTQSFVVKRYDTKGREAFTSYPVATLGTINDDLKGTRTFYDALDRVIRIEADSDGGAMLVSTNEYLSGHRVRVTDPQGNQTTTSYRAYDVPSYDEPISIVAPEGVSTTIVRDVFGKPLTVTRSGPSG